MDLTSSIDFTLDFTAQAGQFEQRYISHLLTELEIELTDIVDLNLAFTWDHVGRPQADAVVPKRDDYRLTVGFTLEF